MGTIQTIVTLARVLLVAVAFLAFIAALLDPPISDEPMLLKCTTEDKPAAGSAGAYAALIAVTTGGLAPVNDCPNETKDQENL